MGAAVGAAAASFPVKSCDLCCPRLDRTGQICIFGLKVFVVASVGKSLVCTSYPNVLSLRQGSTCPFPQPVHRTTRSPPHRCVHHVTQNLLHARYLSFSLTAQLEEFGLSRCEQGGRVEACARKSVHFLNSETWRSGSRRGWRSHRVKRPNCCGTSGECNQQG